MEEPGGYQFIGRNLQMWNRFQQTKEFSKPWLLRFFVQIRFVDLIADKLLERAFQDELTRWIKNGQLDFSADSGSPDLELTNEALTANTSSIDSPVAGSLWHLQVPLDDLIEAGQVAAIVESTEMENSMTASCSGLVSELSVSQRRNISADQRLMVITNEPVPD